LPYGRDPRQRYVGYEPYPQDCPGTVKTAVLLMGIGGLLSLASFIVAAATHIPLAGFGIPGIVLWLWMATASSRGRNWARITGTILCALGWIIFVLVAAYAAVGEPHFWLTVVGGTLLQCLIGLAAVILTWVPASRAYFIPRPAQ
jgi:hypothetical protein